MFMRRYDTRSLAGRQGLRCLLVNLSAASLPFEFNIFFCIKNITYRMSIKSFCIKFEWLHLV